MAKKVRKIRLGKKTYGCYARKIKGNAKRKSSARAFCKRVEPKKSKKR